VSDVPQGEHVDERCLILQFNAEILSARAHRRIPGN